jgi:RNA polymerase primary sigma factor
MPTSSDLYLRDISRFEVLSEDEELKLIWAVKRHNRKAIDRLITSNLRFVISVAKKYRGKGLTFQELISEGNAGLIQACKKFKVEKKVKFISYAVWWIRQSIQAALYYNQVGTIRVPPNRVAEINKFKKELNNNNGDYNKTLDFKEFKNNKVDIIENINKMYGVSLDAPVDGKEDTLVFSDILGTEPEQYIGI